MHLKDQLADFRAGWFKRVPAERQAIMERHIAQLRDGLAKKALKVGDRAPPIYDRGLMHPLRTARNRFKLCWLRRGTARLTGKNSIVADWVTTRSDLS